MLKSICPRCGKVIDYGTRCSCYKPIRSSASDKRYDAKRNQRTRAIYASKQWINTREVIRARDNGLCLMCLAEHKITHSDLVHHIVELTEDESLAYEKDNLICLCSKCHKKIHKEYNRGEEHKRAMQSKLKEFVVNGSNS